MWTYEAHKCSPEKRSKTELFVVHPVHDPRADPECCTVRGGGATVFDKSVQHRSFSYLVVAPQLVANRPASPRRNSGKGQDGSAPPFFGGRSRPNYPCGKAPIPNPKRALTRRRQAP